MFLCLPAIHISFYVLNSSGNEDNIENIIVNFIFIDISFNIISK